MAGFTLSRRQALVIAAGVLAFVLVAAHLFSAPSATTSARPAPPLTTSAPLSTPVPHSLTVDVEGAVRRPGVYHLATGSRTVDAIARAGGATRRADRSILNLAAPLADGQQVLVPRTGGLPGSSGDAAPDGPAPPVDLNTATTDQLDALPGVGPVTAEKIVEYRSEHGPFTSVDQLDAITGIGPARIDDLRGHVIP